MLFNFFSFIIKVKAMGLRRISDRKETEVDLYSTYMWRHIHVIFIK